MQNTASFEAKSGLKTILSTTKVRHCLESEGLSFTWVFSTYKSPKYLFFFSFWHTSFWPPVCVECMGILILGKPNRKKHGHLLCAPVLHLYMFTVRHMKKNSTLPRPVPVTSHSSLLEITWAKEPHFIHIYYYILKYRGLFKTLLNVTTNNSNILCNKYFQNGKYRKLKF